MSDSSSDSSSDEQPVRQPTSSQIFFTPEERQFRRQYRLGKSEICLSELWKFYNKLVLKWKVPEEVVPEETDDLLSYSEIDFTTFSEDPTDDKRQAFLAKKYKYLLDGIAFLIRCPDKPYLLTQKSRELDSPGRRHVLPRAIKATRPEVFANTAPPFEGTMSYTKKWVNVSNLNFEVMRGWAQQHTQTVPQDINMTCRISARFQQDPEKDDIQVDLLDIPLDEDGNPIGKRTGKCEWCKQEILPIPTTHVLSTTWDRSVLYCCRKYRELVEEVLKFHAHLLTVKHDSDVIIDARHMMKPEQLMTLDPELADHIRKKQAEKPTHTMMNKRARDALAKIKAAGAWKYMPVDKANDTYDLFWDPFETLHAKLFPFNMPFDESMEHVYQHIQVVLTQSGVIFNDRSGSIAFDDLGDLNSISKAAEQASQPAEDEKSSP